MYVQCTHVYVCECMHASCASMYICVVYTRPCMYVQASVMYLCVYVCMCMCVYVCVSIMYLCVYVCVVFVYGVATICRLLKIIGLFLKRAL